MGKALARIFHTALLIILINTGLQPGESGDRDNSRFNGFSTHWESR
jgi:hypothetical protein